MIANCCPYSAEKPSVAVCERCEVALGPCHIHFGEDGNSRCAYCLSKVSQASSFEPAWYASQELSPHIPTTLVILHGLHVCGAARRCLESLLEYREAATQTIALAVSGGGRWFEKFRQASDATVLLNRPGTSLPAWLQHIFRSVDRAEAHYQPAVEWALDALPDTLQLDACFHTEPLSLFDDHRLLLRAIKRRASCIFPTDALMHAYGDLLPSAAQQKFLRLSCVQPNRFPRSVTTASPVCDSDLTNFGMPSDRVGIVTRLDHDKLSIPMLIGVLKCLAKRRPRAVVAIAGVGEDSDEVIAAVRQVASALPPIRFLGYVDRIESVYAWASAMFLPSWTEAMPYAVIEAAGFGLRTAIPSLSISDSGLEAFDPFFFPLHDYESGALAIERCLDISRATSPAATIGHVR